MQLIYTNQIFISDIEDWRDSAERRMYSLHPSQAAHNYLQLQIQGTCPTFPAFLDMCTYVPNTHTHSLIKTNILNYFEFFFFHDRFHYKLE